MSAIKKTNRYDYSRFTDTKQFDIKTLGEFQFWGLHPKNGRLRIDTKRYKKMCHWIGINDFLPKKLFSNRNSVYFLPKRIKRYDYKVNLFRDEINKLIFDWENEFKPIFKFVKSPNEVEKQVWNNELLYGSSDDYNEIMINSRMAGFSRLSSFSKVINSIYHQFILKITIEIDRITLKVLSELGYKDSDFSFTKFTKFAKQLNNKVDFKSLQKYNAYNLLHKVANFLKHNSRESYESLKKFYPNNVFRIENGTSKTNFENGMYAGDWIVLKDDYIDDVLKKIMIFFEEFSKSYLNEDIEDSYWNYDEYFKYAVKKMKNVNIYYGIP
jgi:hypothetical protein